MIRGKCSKCAWEVETTTWNEVQKEVSVLLNISYTFMFSPFSALLYHLHLHLFMLTCACHTVYKYGWLRAHKNVNCP